MTESQPWFSKDKSGIKYAVVIPAIFLGIVFTQKLFCLPKIGSYHHRRRYVAIDPQNLVEIMRKLFLIRPEIRDQIRKKLIQLATRLDLPLDVTIRPTASERSTEDLAFELYSVGATWIGHLYKFPFDILQYLF